MRESGFRANTFTQKAELQALADARALVSGGIQE